MPLPVWGDSHTRAGGGRRVDLFHPPTLGDRIRTLRRQRGLTSVQLARAASISQPFVTEIELGKKSPSFSTLERIAQALEVSLADLLDSERGSSRRVPIINRASCGVWLDQTDLDFPVGVSERYLVTDVDDPNAFYVEAQGESMTGGRIHPGDMLLVSPNAEVRPGDIVLAKGAEGVTVKRLRQHDTRIVLEALHPDYPDLVVDPTPDFRVFRVVRVEFQL